MKKYNFWCDAQGQDVIEFDDDADECDIKEAFSEWIESLGEDETELRKSRSCGYYED